MKPRSPSRKHQYTRYVFTAVSPREMGMTRVDPFTEEKAEAWRREVTGPMSHSLLVMKPAAMEWPRHLSH